MHQIVRVIENFEDAERARQALLAEGFERDSIEISHTGDEAGPSEANFTVGDSPSVKGGADYKDVYAPGLEIAKCVIMVTAPDAARLERAVHILDEHGAIDHDAAHRRQAGQDRGGAPVRTS
jgi:hypothetical protein